MNTANIKSLNKLANSVYNFYVGEEENVLMDFSEDSEEYKSAKAFLDNPQMVYESVYNFLREELGKPWYKNLKFQGTEAIQSSVITCMIRDGYDIANIKY